MAPCFLAASFPDFGFLNPSLANPGMFLFSPPEVKVAVMIADVTDEVPFTVQDTILADALKTTEAVPYQ